ncbi:RNA-binding S4 domain-containing protein [Bauldia sp.]|uniref:RNA-binding S4 domain-containing protein n=1 Tax=Bauldia sp. TaxID=2575872 RepID=UPI003BAB7259
MTVEPDGERLRIDKWLWFARLARTRTSAQKLAVSGKVRVNREKNASASRTIRVGDVLTVALDSGVRVLRILALGERRGPATEARTLYEDLAPPEPGHKRPPPPSRVGPRPTKRDRRTLDRETARAANRHDFPRDDT